MNIDHWWIKTVEEIAEEEIQFAICCQAITLEEVPIARQNIINREKGYRDMVLRTQEIIERMVSNK